MENIGQSQTGSPVVEGLQSDQCSTTPQPPSVSPGIDGSARSTITLGLKSEQHQLIERLAQVHQDLKEVDNIPEENLQFFLRNRYRW